VDGIAVSPTVAYVDFVCAIICAKWAMELGFSQFRQMLWGVAGFVVPPLVLLILYNRLIRQATESRRKSAAG
jgi:hypothetical protein